MAYSSFQFSQPVLTNAVFHVLGPLGEEMPAPNVHVHRNIIKTEGRQAIVELTIQLNKKMDKIAEDAPYYAELTMQSMFHWDESIDDNQADQFLDFNAAALLISYIRPLISTITSASPVPTINIPFINVIDLFNSQKNHSKENSD